MGNAAWIRSATWLFMVIALSACRVESPPPEPRPESTLDANLVIARTSTTAITAADVERYVGRQGAISAGPASATLSERYVAIARRMVVEELLLAEAEAKGFGGAAGSQGLDRQQRRHIYSQQFLRHQGDPEPTTEAQLQAHFEGVKARLDQPERRRVSHIFLRYTDASDHEEVRQRLEEIRLLVEAGHPFSLMAREHSESESRHRDGLLGFVERGIFPPDFDEIVFALEPETPSDVASTRDGAHLFYVHNVLPAQEVEYDDVRELLRRELTLQQQVDRLRAAASSIPSPEVVQLVEPERLLALLGSAPPDQPLAKVGDVVITVAELREQLQTWSRHLAELTSHELPSQILQGLSSREVIFQHILEREKNGEDTGLQEEEIARASHEMWIDELARQKMVARLDANFELLEEYRQQHALRFSSPLRVKLERLWVQPGESGSATMGELEAARRALDLGDITLSQLARQLGGTVERSQSLSVPELLMSDPKAVGFVPLLLPGEHSPPYFHRGRLTMFTLLERTEPQPLPLDEVRELVISDYLQQHSVAVFEEIADEMLEEAGFEVQI